MIRRALSARATRVTRAGLRAGGSPWDDVPNLTMTESPPNLDITVQTLKTLSRSLSSNAPRKVADVYLAGIGLLCHLKDDQATLHRIRYVVLNRFQRSGIQKCGVEYRKYEHYFASHNGSS